MNFCLKVPGNAEVMLKKKKRKEILILPLLYWMSKFTLPAFMHLPVQKSGPLERTFYENCSHTCTHILKHAQDRHIPQDSSVSCHSFGISSSISTY